MRLSTNPSTPPSEAETSVAGPIGARASQWLRARPSFWKPELPVWAAVLLSLPMLIAFIGLVFYPLIQLVITSLGGGGSAYRVFFHSGPELRALQTTLWDSALVTVITLVVGSVIAWTLHTSQSKLMRVLYWTAVLIPLSMSVVVKNFAWMTILGRFGVVNWALRAAGLPTHDFLFTTTAVTAGMVYSLFPFAVFPLFITFRSIPDDLLHAATSMGSRSWQSATTVVLPLAVPGIFITGVLLFVLSIGFYVTPVVLGGPNSTFLSVLVQGDLLLRFDQRSAAATSVMMMVVALLLVVVALRLVGKERFERALG